jgi:hypothetical protein
MSTEWYVRLAEGKRRPLSSEILRPLALEADLSSDLSLKCDESSKRGPAGHERGRFVSIANSDRPPAMSEIGPSPHSLADGNTCCHGPSSSRSLSFAAPTRSSS